MREFLTLFALFFLLELIDVMAATKYDLKEIIWLANTAIQNGYNYEG